MHPLSSFDPYSWEEPIYKASANGSCPRIGLEMEFHGYHAKTLEPLGTSLSESYTPQQLLREASALGGGKIKTDESTGELTGVSLSTGGNFSLEPGGQIEYSSAPFKSLEEVAEDTYHGLQLLENAAAGKVLFLSHGTNPLTAPTHPLLVPKQRYQIMTRYFESNPPALRGIHMMRHSATIQPNLDVIGEHDWQDAVDLTLTLVPLTRYLFANSAFFQGQRSNFLSERQEIWRKMDPSRSGIPYGVPFHHQTAAAYAEWAKQAFVYMIPQLSLEEQPLYGELTFEQWLTKGYRNTFPSVEDWHLHVGTLFPELRLRHFLEVRHLDAQPFSYSLTPIAFFSILIQFPNSRAQTWKFLQQFGKTPRQILADPYGDYSIYHRPLLALAQELAAARNLTFYSKLISRYLQFYNNKTSYWNAKDASSFVASCGTLKPAQQFLDQINN